MKNFVPKIGKGKAQEVTAYFKFGGGWFLRKIFNFFNCSLFSYFNSER